MAGHFVRPFTRFREGCATLRDLYGVTRSGPYDADVNHVTIPRRPLDVRTPCELLLSPIAHAAPPTRQPPLSSN